MSLATPLAPPSPTFALTTFRLRVTALPVYTPTANPGWGILPTLRNILRKLPPNTTAPFTGWTLFPTSRLKSWVSTTCLPRSSM
ncbi:unnamed protein product [Symbiodinium sp. KB8]|nr:unnamed protein product [Symbiodinium sp. KB8]